MEEVDFDDRLACEEDDDTGGSPPNDIEDEAEVVVVDDRLSGDDEDPDGSAPSDAEEVLLCEARLLELEFEKIPPPFTDEGICPVDWQTPWDAASSSSERIEIIPAEQFDIAMRN